MTNGIYARGTIREFRGVKILTLRKFVTCKSNAYNRHNAPIRFRAVPHGAREIWWHIPGKNPFGGTWGNLFHSLYGSNSLSAPTTSRTDDIYAEEKSPRTLWSRFIQILSIRFPGGSKLFKTANAYKVPLTMVYRTEYIGWPTIECKRT